MNTLNILKDVRDQDRDEKSGKSPHSDDFHGIYLNSLVKTTGIAVFFSPGRK